MTEQTNSTDSTGQESAALSSEDAKLVTLARATRARVGAAQGAAVRDEVGRTYAAASVELPSLRLSAVQVCVAMAVASGSRAVVAAVLLGDDVEASDDDRGALADLAPGGDAGAVALHLGDPRGTVTSSTTAG